MRCLRGLKRTALLIDGGAPRSWAGIRGLRYSGDLVEELAYACLDEETEELIRILYYDCDPYEGVVARPISGMRAEFTARSSFLDEIATRERFAVRRGTLVFRGWQLRRYDLEPGEPLADDHFKPRFEQKGVDMRIGLDIANFAERRSVDRLLLVTVDNDMVPAMKYARRAGLEMGIVELPYPARVGDELRRHADFTRSVAWNDEDARVPAEPVLQGAEPEERDEGGGEPA